MMKFLFSAAGGLWNLGEDGGLRLFNAFFSGTVKAQTLYATGIERGTCELTNPGAGVTYDVPNGTRRVVITGTGTKASLTVQLPGSPEDGQLFTLGSRCDITAMTFQDDGGSAIAGSATAVGKGLGYSFIYVTSNGLWYPT